MIFGEDTFIMLKFKLKGQDYTIEEIVKIIDEVLSLREENVKLNKDRSALHDTKDKLQKQIKYLEKYSQEDGVIIKSQEKELISRESKIRELEDENKHLKQQVSDLEEIIRDVDDFEHEEVIEETESVIREQQRDLDIRSDKIHNLETELKWLKDYCEDLSDCNKAKCAQVQDQQAIIEFQKNDIERLVKLNAELQYRLDTYKKVLYFNIYSGQ